MEQSVAVTRGSSESKLNADIARLFELLGFSDGFQCVFKAHLRQHHSLRALTHSACAPAGIPKIGDPIPIRMDCALSLQEQVILGRYDKVALFPWDLQCKALDSVAYTKDVFLAPLSWRDACESSGFELQGLSELLALGAQYPELQRYYTVVALGSSMTVEENMSIAPGLGADGDERVISAFRSDVVDASYLILVSRER